MDDAGYVLSEFDANWVVSNAGQREGERRETVRRIGPQCVLCQAPVGGIAARSGSTISSAACTVYKGSGGALGSLSRTISVYNIGTRAVPASSYFLACLAGNIWVYTPIEARPGIIDIRLSGSNLQYTFDGTNWTTWTTGTTCP